MNQNPEKLKQIKPSGKRYTSVGDMLNGLSAESNLVEQFQAAQAESRLVDMLVDLRRAAGLTQEAIAEKMGVTQSAVSKWESGKDEDLSVKIVGEYAKAADQRVALFFGKRVNHVEAVKCHAMEIKRHLSALASLAHKDNEIEASIQEFFGEAFFNILTILAKCQEQMPNGSEFEVRLQVVGTKPIRKLPKGPSARMVEA